MVSMRDQLLEQLYRLSQCFVPVNILSRTRTSSEAASTITNKEEANTHTTSKRVRRQDTILCSTSKSAGRSTNPAFLPSEKEGLEICAGTNPAFLAEPIIGAAAGRFA